ncbi:MAG: hypothetical protein PWQ75_2475 [Methanolobus sp.]|jgi:hypothetical protein|uniref:hypothetical protein n=1 Tax=Methanolobus sp. TaxID=1874737 RepID=UPI0024AB8A0A|nr:hypothetical protein [Methanolobus sp.]MDI3485073.1 hypothetical protein [Methanolobus sp.]MDK2832723.1 hypothetical protein [Methanolobus sp.]
MKHKYCSVILVFVILLSVYSSGCVSSDSEEEVPEIVTTFLTAINDDDFNTAFNMYTGKDFLAVASIEMIFSNKGIEPGTIQNINIVSQEINGSAAVVDVECTVLSPDGQSSTIPIYFILQNSQLGWIITRVSFTVPLTLDNVDEVNIEMETTKIDVIANNAPLIFIAAVIMLGLGLYIDKKDKARKKENSRIIDVSGATPIQKESIAQYVKFVPSQQISIGKTATVDVWVKNFTQQPYHDFAIKGKFANTLEPEKINLFFDTIAPGETVKRTWVVKPKLSGWASIEDPTVVFNYGGTKYMGVLDSVWLQVQ